MPEALICGMAETLLDTSGNVLKVGCQATATLYISQSRHVKLSRDSSVTLVTRILTGQQRNHGSIPGTGQEIFLLFQVFVLAVSSLLFNICRGFTGDKADGV